MTQNIVDFSDNPTGEQLMDDYLAKLQENVNTSNSGILRPSYAVAGTHWIDTSVKPWMLKVYDGANDIIEGYIDVDNNLYIPAGLTDVVDYTNITNCLTEIPQDIKLELNNGTLTLKAGSKVYVPNGVGKFDVKTLSKDLQYKGNYSDTRMIVVNSNLQGLDGLSPESMYSGNSAPKNTKYMFWYDTANNIIKLSTDTGISWTGQYSLPICIETSSSLAITSIDQVFNGFGYIGNTLFALPGVKGLIPSGFNTDGSLNSIERTSSSIAIKTLNGASTNGALITNLSGTIESSIWFSPQAQDYPDSYTGRYYNYAENYIKLNFTGRKWAYQDGYMLCAYFTADSTGRITSLTPNTAFHAVDYSEFAREVGRCAKVDEDNTFDKINVFDVSKSTGRIRVQNKNMDFSAQSSSSLEAGIYFYDKDSIIGAVEAFQTANSSEKGVRFNSVDEDGNWGFPMTYVHNTSENYVSFPTPSIGDNSTKGATTAWVVKKIKSFVPDESRKTSTNLATDFSDTYTATQDGILAIDYQANGNGYIDVLKNGIKIGRWGAKTYSETTVFIQVQPNDIISFSGKIGSIYIVSQYFAPYKGV